MCNPEFGFKLTCQEDVIGWWMYKSWKKGISPREFKKCQMRDLNLVMGIDNAIGEKDMREAQVRKMMSQVH